MNIRVAAPTPPRGWIVAAAVASAAWLATVVTNGTAIVESGQAIPPQANAIGVGAAASLTVVAVVLYAMRRIREGQGEVFLRVARLTDAYRTTAEVHERLISAVKQNSAVINALGQQVQQVGQSYANLLQEVGMGIPAEPRATVPGQRQGRLN